MPPAGEPLRLLILGGTREARELAGHLAGDPRIAVVTSLAGRTRTPHVPPGELRVGGFGGSEGLVAWLRRERIGFLVDATHPFARRISAHALEACRRLGLPSLRLERPCWRPAPGDRWIEVADLDAALALLPCFGRRVFASLGRGALPHLAGCSGCRFLLRTVEPLSPLPANVEAVAARPPYTVAGDRALLLRFGAEVLLVRNSGGEGGVSKLLAARELDLPVVMIARPPPLPGRRVASVAEAVAVVTAYLRGRRM